MTKVSNSSPSAVNIGWITNVAAPYRRPVWLSLAQNSRLTVHLLENPTRLRRSKNNRGDDWSSYGDAEYAIVEVPSMRIAKGETVVYVAMGRIFNRQRPDAVLIGGWESPAYWQALIWCKLHSVPAIGFYESTLATNRFRKGPIAWARRRFFLSLRSVVVPGPAARAALEEMGIEPARIYQGFNAVDGVTISKATAIHRRESKMTDPQLGHRFLYIGQLIDRKNVDSLISSFIEIARAADSLTIVGNGERLAPLRDAARLNGKNGAIHFVDMVPYVQLPLILSKHDTLVLPSIEEVWGLVVNEGLAAGLHVVVTDNCGVALSVAQMPGVYLTTPDVCSLANAMLKSQVEWDGPIEDPPILRESPEAFADVFLRALSDK